MSPMGKVIGRHKGAHFYTIGQRKGLNIGGYKEPLFIIATDTGTNTIYVGEGHEHPGLNRKGSVYQKRRGSLHSTRSADAAG
jgi:tRNA-uridine 2-sulfurtransferase